MSDKDYMSDKEYVANIPNLSNKKLIDGLEWCGHDNYYNVMYYPIVEEIKKRLSKERTGMMTNHEVACMLADLFDDPCACNYNGIDEWLPFKCELQDACPNPVGVACWEQYLKWRTSLGNSEKK